MDAAQKESSRKDVTLNIYFFRGFIFLFPARFAAARPLVVYGYFFFPTLGISNSPHTKNFRHRSMRLDPDALQYLSRNPQTNEATRVARR